MMKSHGMGATKEGRGNDEVLQGKQEGVGNDKRGRTTEKNGLLGDFQMFSKSGDNLQQ